LYFFVFNDQLWIQSDVFFFYPALTGSKTPTSQGLEKNEKDRWEINCRMRPIGLGQQDVGHSGVVTGRGAFNLSSSISVGDEENPH
jgi:hypothetical protein